VKVSFSLKLLKARLQACYFAGYVLYRHINVRDMDRARRFAREGDRRLQNSLEQVPEVNKD
jgi:hypothetical protein